MASAWHRSSIDLLKMLQPAKAVYAGRLHHHNIRSTQDSVRSSCDSMRGSLELRSSSQVVQDMLAEGQVAQPALNALLPGMVLGDVALRPPLHLHGVFKVPHFCTCQERDSASMSRMVQQPPRQAQPLSGSCLAPDAANEVCMSCKGLCGKYSRRHNGAISVVAALHLPDNLHQVKWSSLRR